MVREEELQDATLDGMPCRAAAWIDARRLDVLRKGESRPVTGLRTWRGIAVLDNANAKVMAGWVNRPVEYSGLLRIGNEEREVSGNVFITSYRRSRPSQRSSADNDIGSTYYIEFTGAGNLPESMPVGVKA